MDLLCPKHSVKYCIYIYCFVNPHNSFSNVLLVLQMRKLRLRVVTELACAGGGFEQDPLGTRVSVPWIELPLVTDCG